MSDFNRRGKLPFQIVSSSVNTGYNVELTAAVGSNLEIVNQHQDEYGGLQDAPMQGPFTEQWVGGNQHRHIHINNGTDDASNRPEAFLVSGSTGKVRVYGPDYFDPKAPKALLTRDTVSKSPLNIKNIKNENRRLGNFSHNYQVVQTSGRELNQSLVQNNLTASGVLTTKFIEGVEDYSLPEITGNINKTVFVERFSAPGDRKESSRGALDRESEQYSPNNSLVTRNIKVRQPFYSQLTQHAAQFNSGSLEGVTVHAINRNTIKSVELSGTTFVTASDYDNFWVQHAIPSTDLRYKWIADSVIDSGSILQYQKPFNPSELVFNSASLVVSGTNKQFSVDNVGIRSLIKGRKSINLQSNTITYSSPGLSASFSEIANSAYQYPVWKQIRTGEHPVSRKLRNNNIVSIEGSKSKVINNVQTQSKRSDSVFGYIDPPVTIKHKPLKQVLELKGSTEKYVFKFSHTNNLGTFANQELLAALNIKEGSQQTYDLLKKYYSDPNRLNNPDNPVIKLHSYAFSETLYPKEVNTYLAETRARTAYILTQSGFTRDGYDRQLGTQRAFWRDKLLDRMRSIYVSRNSLNFQIDRPTTTELATQSPYIELPGYATYAGRQWNVTNSFAENTFKSNNSIHSFDNSPQITDIYGTNRLTMEGEFVQDPGTAIGDLAIATRITTNANSGELNREVMLDYFSSCSVDFINFNDSKYPTFSDGVQKQLTRVTPHSVLLQYIQELKDLSLSDKYKFPSTYPSYSSMTQSLPVPQPKYLAFLGGFESVSNRSRNFENELNNIFDSKPSGTLISTLDSGLRYATESFGDKKPWFDSYEDYSDDIRNIGKEYSILPEFRISSHMPYYVKDSGGNFRAINRAFLENDGSGISYRTAIAANSSSDQGYIKSYVLGEEISNAYELQQENANVTKLDKITFTLSGIKKLLPYNGFYPQERTLQLANLFNDFLDTNVGGGYFSFIRTVQSASTGAGDANDVLIYNTDDSGSYWSKNVVMPYLFSPGILFNTIKSGISVDFPIITASLLDIQNINFTDITGSKTTILTVKELNIFDKCSILSKNCNLISLTGSQTSATNRLDPYIFDASYISENRINSRIPFESLIFPQEFLEKPDVVTSSFIYSNSVDITLTGSLQVQLEDLYSKYISNSILNIKFDCNHQPDRYRQPLFTSGSSGFTTINSQFINIGFYQKNSVPFAYLKDDKIIDPSYSLAMSNFLAEIPTFFLRDSSMISFKSSEMKDWKFEIGKKYYFDLKMKKSSDLVMIESYRSQHHITGSNSIEKTMNGRYFGWPVSKQSNERTVEDNYVVHNDPAYAPFTPPYFEGEAILRFELSASRTSYRDSSFADFQKDINLVEFFPAISGAIGTGSAAYRNKMSMQDCINLFGLGINPLADSTPDGKATSIRGTTDTANQFWVISPKLETPVLDFSEQQFIQRTGSYWVADGYGRGMWSGYGKIPTGSQGITLELAESFPLNTDFRSNRINTSATGSLLKQVGFKAESKKIGQLAEKKTISEAIVAIPFVDRPIEGVTTFVDGYHFFSVNPFVFESQKTQLELNTLPKETSISRMIRLMKQYVIPPNFDFLTYYKNPLTRTIRDNREGIDPFVMYMFEFAHDLDQQDLADIWQGVMPKIATTAEKEQITFSHDVGENELFGENFKLPPNMRWMIFKVKKKAEWNYFAVTEDTQDDVRFKFNFANSQEAQTPKYNYNWPYDYFSLVELAKVDVTYEYGEKPTATGSIDNTIIGTGIDTNRFAIGNNPDFLDQGKVTSTTAKDPKRQLASGFMNKQNKTRGKRTRL
jgi:hypothetical protein